MDGLLSSCFSGFHSSYFCPIVNAICTSDHECPILNYATIVIQSVNIIILVCERSICIQHVRNVVTEFGCLFST